VAEREKNLQTVVEIGKMLLDKNTELNNQSERHVQSMQQLQLEVNYQNIRISTNVTRFISQKKNS
jgi:hypothetical protein